MERHVENTRKVIAFLGRERGGSIAYPDCLPHPDHVSRSGFSRAAAARSSAFDLKGGRDAGRRFIEA